MAWEECVWEKEEGLSETKGEVIQCREGSDDTSTTSDVLKLQLLFKLLCSN